MDVECYKYNFIDGHVGVLAKTKLRLGVRHIQVIYMFLCAVSFGVLRGSTGLTVLSMTDPTRLNDTYIQVYDWSSKTKGTILSSYFWGFALMTIPAEVFIKKYNGKTILAVVLLLSGFTYVVLPVIISQGGWGALCNTVFILGMSQACLLPALESLFRSWVPPNEQFIFKVIIYGGIQFGIIISFPFCGFVSSEPLGWMLITYSMAMLTLSGAVIWILLTGSSPEDHPAVGNKEREYIGEHLGYFKKIKLEKPWREILKSQVFWSITAALASSSALFVFYIVEVPAYLKFVLQLTLKECSWYMIYPFIGMWFVYAIGSPVFESFYNIGYINYNINLTYYRKIINALGALGVICGMVLISHPEIYSLNIKISILGLTLSFLGFQYIGFLDNIKDITENFPSTLLVMSSAIASTVGAMVPLLTGLLISDMADSAQWKIVFWSLAAFHAICNIIFTVLGSSEKQSWDNSNVIRRKLNQYIVVNQVELEEFRLNGKEIQKTTSDF